jgi:hypothetical protein
VTSFLKVEEHKYIEHFVNEVFLVKLAYLCYIFGKLDALNLPLQGSNIHLLKLMENISVFIKKTKAIEKKNE